MSEETKPRSSSGNLASRVKESIADFTTGSTDRLQRWILSSFYMLSRPFLQEHKKVVDFVSASIDLGLFIFHAHSLSLITEISCRVKRQKDNWWGINQSPGQVFPLGMQKVDDSSSAMESFSSRHRFLSLYHLCTSVSYHSHRSKPFLHSLQTISLRWKSKLHTGRRIREKDSSAPPPLIRYCTWLRYLSILNKSRDWPSDFPSRLIDFLSILQWSHSGSVWSNSPMMGSIMNNRSGSSSLSHLALSLCSGFSSHFQVFFSFLSRPWGIPLPVPFPPLIYLVQFTRAWVSLSWNISHLSTRSVFPRISERVREMKRPWRGHAIPRIRLPLECRIRWIAIVWPGGCWIIQCLLSSRPFPSSIHQSITVSLCSKQNPSFEYSNPLT